MARKPNPQFMKPVSVSPALAAVVGNGPMPRTQVMKKLWAYIKKHGLQDTKNKRMVKPDAVLGKVVGNSPLLMFAMTKKVFAHLGK
jgi:chromatin remodeling complex protein RSC6